MPEASASSLRYARTACQGRSTPEITRQNDFLRELGKALKGVAAANSNALVRDGAALCGQLRERDGPAHVHGERREKHQDEHAAEGVPEQRRDSLQATGGRQKMRRQRM